MVRLYRRQDELSRLNAQVWVVSFGSADMSKIWLEQTCPEFLMLVDPDRNVYKSYGMRHSWWRSWNIKTLWYYTKAVLTGRKLLGVKGDASQLGGDFVIDTDGTLLLSHPSGSATDRPSVDQLFEVLRPDL
ncbi:MAG: redoxin domain-containing protein [Chloroflexi bacterium]|nr:redoxin domain-containing protein [Chloroflexota bacterium]